MECGKLTAKLRDAVPVCFIENGKEIKRFKNIEIPDEIKVLPFKDYKFDVPMTGAITFKIMFEAGILPAEWPQTRERKSRNAKAAPVTVEMPNEAAQPDEPQDAAPLEVAEETTQETTTVLAIIQPDPLTAISEAAQQAEAIEEAESEPETSATMEIAYNVTGEQRKALIKAVSNFTGEPAVYQNAPTFAFVIGGYTVDKNGTLTGPANDQLLQGLTAQNLIAA